MKILYSKTLNVLLALILLGVNNFGQSDKKIFGYVYDNDSGLPLVGANVIINGSGMGVTTDANGYYRFNNILTGNYTLTASFIGYGNKSIDNVIVKNDQPVKIDFRLTIKEHQLKEIIVTSNGSKEESFGTIKIYTKNDIEKNNYQSVDEFLKEVSGIEIQSTGSLGSSKKISIRGSQANQVLVLLDGVKLNNQLGGGFDLSRIPTNIIEKIEIYKGGTSPKFGNGAIGGTINIITKNKFTNTIKLNTGIGSYGFWKVEPVISGNYGNASYYFSYNRVRSKGNFSYSYKNNSSGLINDIRLNSDFKSENIFARINYRFGNNFFSSNIQYFNSERGIPGAIYSLTPYAQSKYSNNIFGINYTSRSKYINVKTDIIYSNSTTNYSNQFPDSAKPKYKRVPKYNYEYQVSNITGNLDIIYVPNNWYKLTAGYNLKSLDYKDKNFRPTLNTPINNANDFSHGIFLHQEIKKKFQWNNLQVVLSPVIRYDVIKLNSKKKERNEDKWSPGLSLYLSAGNKNTISVKTNYSKSFRMPTFADLFYQDVRIEGKTSLLPETGTNTDIEIKAGTNLYGKLTGSITFFKNIIDNLIVWKLGSFEVFKPFNTDAEITGRQFELEYQSPNNHFSFNFSHTILNPLNKNKNITTYNKIIPYKPLTSTKIRLGTSFNNLNFNLLYRAVGKRYVTEANTVEMPSYSVLDGNINYQFHLTEFTLLLKISVTNITNENYQIIKNYPLPLREWRLGFTISY